MSQENKQHYSHLDRLKHMSWCNKNDIKIYFLALNYYSGKIVIEEKGKKFIMSEIYKQPTKKQKLKRKDKEYWTEIYKLYTNKFLKYNKQ